MTMEILPQCKDITEYLKEESYTASLIAVIFDKKYDFQDILHIGIAHSKEEAGYLLNDELSRLIEDYTPHEITVKEGRSLYDEPITIVKAGNGDIYHYYLMFDKDRGEN